MGDVMELLTDARKRWGQQAQNNGLVITGAGVHEIIVTLEEGSHEFLISRLTLRHIYDVNLLFEEAASRLRSKRA